MKVRARRRLAVAAAVGAPVLALLSVTPTATADDTAVDTSGTATEVVGTQEADPSQFTDASALAEKRVSEDVAEESADMGVLVDGAEVVVQQAPGVGYVAGTEGSLDAVSAVGVTESAVTDDSDAVIGKELEYSLVTTPAAQTATRDGAETALPLGPGSLSVKFFAQEPCTFLYGDDTGNYVTACETLGYLDGGNGRKAYNVADDDGSKIYDWFTYHQWGTIHPSDSGLDWIITSAEKTSYITDATVTGGNPGVTDYAPNDSSCDGALSMGVSAFAFDFSGELCDSGKEIFHPDGNGSFGQKLDIGLIAPSNSKSLNYRISIRIKQGVRPDWRTVNKAKFRKQFSLTTNSINGTS